MQQFTVPQFIDVEDKIIGPITTRQFIIMLTGFVVIGVSYKIFDFSLFVTVSSIIFIFAVIFAFLKVNGRPFHYFILNFIQTLKRPQLRTWNNLIGRLEYGYEEYKKAIVEEKVPALAKRFTATRLTELSLIVDTQGAYQGEEEEEKVEQLEIKQTVGKIK